MLNADEKSPALSELDSCIWWAPGRWMRGAQEQYQHQLVCCCHAHPAMTHCLHASMPHRFHSLISRCSSLLSCCWWQGGLALPAPTLRLTDCSGKRLNKVLPGTAGAANSQERRRAGSELLLRPVKGTASLTSTPLVQQSTLLLFGFLLQLRKRFIKNTEN